jgi:hypothetical protein
MILLWGVPADPPITAVERILRRERVPYAFLDERAVLETELTLRCDGNIGGTLSMRGDVVRLEEITAVYPRPYDLQLIQGLATASPDSAEWLHAVALHHALSIWLDLTPALVLNRPRDMALNYSKPYQSRLIETFGFRIPETLLTTDSSSLDKFRMLHDGLIYKSVSAVRSIVAQLCSEDEPRLTNLACCPTQFQERITGTEVRVHVIGEQCFACEILTAADDYRYAALSGDTLEIRPYVLSADCAVKCVSMVKAMNLTVAGIDLRCQHGTWYCFEVNPSPGFMYYQTETGQPIDEAIAQLLITAQKA